MVTQTETMEAVKTHTQSKTHKYIDFFYENEFLKHYFHQKK